MVYATKVHTLALGLLAALGTSALASPARADETRTPYGRAIDRVETSTAAIIGPRASTVRTEGGAIGGLLGASWSFAPNWAFGFTARYMQWFLPHEAATTVFLDRASLTGEQRAFNFGISCS